MNPMKVLKEALPALKAILESIHAHLELQLGVQKEILLTNKQILHELRNLHEKKD